MPRVADAAPICHRDGLRATAIFGGVGLAVSGLNAATGIGFPCPWRVLTGTLCPFCGSTHLGVALLHGDLAGAWTATPFVFVLLAGLVIACVFWTVELAGGPAVRLRGRLADQRLWYAVLGVAAIVFAVVRNL